jgi:hypothetical protein
MTRLIGNGASNLLAGERHQVNLETTEYRVSNVMDLANKSSVVEVFTGIPRAHITAAMGWFGRMYPQRWVGLAGCWLLEHQWAKQFAQYYVKKGIQH